MHKSGCDRCQWIRDQGCEMDQEHVTVWGPRHRVMALLACIPDPDIQDRKYDWYSRHDATYHPILQGRRPNMVVKHIGVYHDNQTTYLIFPKVVKVPKKPTKNQASESLRESPS